MENYIVKRYEQNKEIENSIKKLTIDVMIKENRI